MEKFEAVKNFVIENNLIYKVIAIAIVLVVFKIAKMIIHRMLNHAEAKGLDSSARPLVESLARYAVAIVALLIILNILGVNTASLVAMVGAASLAVGIALKDMLTNIASGLLLLFLRPFKAGDYIECGSIKGKITGIGLFNTIFETLDGLYVSAPNGSLWGAPITNFSRNEKRRIDLVVGIGYDSNTDKAMEIIRNLIASEPKFLKEGSDVFVSELADSSVNINMRVWVNNADFFPLKAKYTALIKEEFDKAGIEIPFPQRVVHMVNAK